MNEQRKSPRRRVLKAATIQFGGDSIPCMVRNISDAGASIEITSPLWFPDHFTLVVASEGLSKSCAVIWHKEKRVGVKFL
jgi:hypothetical protein